MSQVEHHWSEVSQIEIELRRRMIALGLDWHDEAVMAQLSSECKAFGPDNAQAAYASHEQRLITKAELFGLVMVLIRTMQNAVLEEREVHGGEVWEAFGKHFHL